METLMQMVLPTVVLPLLLSALLWGLARRNPNLYFGLPLIWLPSYLWLIGWSALLPAEANHWLGWLVVGAFLISLILKSRLPVMAVLQTVLLLLVLVAIAWPVLQYQFELMVIIELLTVMTVGLFVFFFLSRDQVVAPALTMTMSSAGMAIVVGLGGSLLIGQLAGTVASTLAVFAGSELFRKRQPSIPMSAFAPVIQLYLVILVIARIFAEIPLGPAILLLAAPVVGLLPARRYAPALSAAGVIAAISWLLLSADSSSYY